MHTHKLLFILLLLLTVTTISAQTHNVTRGTKLSTNKPSNTTSSPSTTTSTKKGNAASSSRKSDGKQRQRKAGSTTQSPIQSPRETFSSSSQSTSSPSLSAEKRRIIDNLINNMVYVTGGTFTMGATPEQGTDAWKDEKPTHKVTLSSYYISRYEVTQEEWEAVMGYNPSKFKGANLPVSDIEWSDCKSFILKLNNITGKSFRLPTEAEWEFAARGGTLSRGYKYSGSNDLDKVAWFFANSGEKFLDKDDYMIKGKLESNNCRPHPVGKKSPNELGLYDMSGNVFEWCSDWKSDYRSSPQTNPMVINQSTYTFHVYRGGSWDVPAGDCRVSYRGFGAPSLRNGCIGIRLVLE